MKKFLTIFILLLVCALFTYAFLACLKFISINIHSNILKAVIIALALIWAFYQKDKLLK